MKIQNGIMVMTRTTVQEALTGGRKIDTSTADKPQIGCPATQGGGVKALELMVGIKCLARCYSTEEAPSILGKGVIRETSLRDRITIIEATQAAL